MAVESLLTYKIIQLLVSKSSASQSKSIATLLEAYQQDEKTLLALKQCLKAWDVPFEGSNTIPDLSPEFYQQLPPEHFGKYFNQKMYPRMYALSHLAYTAEQNGIPAEHATKLCVMFTDEKTALTYLQKYTQSAQASTTPFHDALLFSLPDFQAPGFLDPQTGCKFELFQEKAKTIETLLSKEFKQLLPFAFELQQRVVAVKEAPPAQAVEIPPEKLAFSEQLKVIKEKMALYEEKSKAFVALKKNKSDTDDLEEELNKLKLTLNTLFEKIVSDYSKVRLDTKQHKQLLLEKKECTELLQQYLKSMIKRFDALESQKSELESDEEEEYHTLTTLISEQRCALATLCAGKRLKDLTVAELRAFYEVYKLNASASYQIFVDNHIPPNYFAEFERLDRSKAGAHIPEVLLAGETIEYPGFYLMKVPVATDEQQAARAACFGKLTNCCQSLSGEAGHACARHGLTSPNGGFYVLCQGDSKAPKVSDPVIAQSWAWRSQSDAIVFDSIETVNKNADTIKRVTDFYHQLGKALVEQGHTSKVACGASSGISSKVGVSGVGLSKEAFKDYNGYCDSIQQRAIYDLLQPYLFYDIHEACRNKTRQIITEAPNDIANLRRNKAFIELMNWVVMTQREDVRELIVNAFKSQQQADELKSITEALEDFHQKGNVEVLIRNIDYVDVWNEAGETPLLLAARKCRLDVCSILIEKGADIEAKDKYGDTPLRVAAKNGHVDVCSMLIEKGADIHAKNQYGDTLLHLAASNGHIDVSKMMIERGAKVDEKNESGDTPLMWAAKNGHIDVCSMLIEKGADIHAKNQHGKTPLILAAKKGDIDLSKMLIEKGANIEAKDNSGATPLILAAKKGDIDLSKMLIEKGANIEAKDSDGATLLLYSVENFDVDLFKMLLENGADIEVKDRNDDTPLLIAARNGFLDVCSMLLEKRADIEVKDRGHQTPLLIAARYDHVDVSKMLIEKGANIEAKDRNDDTPLLIAARNGRLDVCSMLIEKGADIHAKDNSGATPLLYAARGGYLGICKMLIEKGAKVDEKTQRGDTPLIFAAVFAPFVQGARDVCIELLRAGAVLDNATLKALHALNDPEINTMIAERLAPPTLPASESTRRQKILFSLDAPRLQQQEPTTSAQSDVKHTRDEATKPPKP